MAFWSWSKTAASNATADASVNWQEGQAPSSVNDSARAMMARTAEYRDDICGAIVTGGTSTAYTVSSNQVFDTLAHMANALIAFTPHTANGATVTINVDGLGAKPLRLSTGVELQSNVLIAGTPYMATYNNSDAVWYLHSLGGNPYGVPLGAGMDFWLPTAPSSAFVFPTGQTLDRTTYATLFAAMGTTFNIGGEAGSVFRLPDKTGRASVMRESSSTRLTATYFGGNSTVLGASGGAESHTLTTAELAVHSHGTTESAHQHTSGNSSNKIAQTAINISTAGATPVLVDGGASLASFSTGLATTGISINNAGSGNAHAIVQPTIVCNYIMRVI